MVEAPTELLTLTMLTLRHLIDDPTSRILIGSTAIWDVCFTILRLSRRQDRIFQDTLATFEITLSKLTDKPRMLAIAYISKSLINEMQPWLGHPQVEDTLVFTAEVFSYIFAVVDAYVTPELWSEFEGAENMDTDWENLRSFVIDFSEHTSSDEDADLHAIGAPSASAIGD